MPRKAYISETINNYDFKNLSKIERNPQTRIRMLGMLHIQEGETLTNIAKMLKVRINTVHDWLKSFNKYGIEGLYDKHRSGRKPWFSEEYKEALISDIQELQKTRKGGRVKGLDIIELIHHKYGVQYSLSGVYTLLHRIGMSWVSARSKHPNSSIAQQEEFKKNFTESK